MSESGTTGTRRTRALRLTLYVLAVLALVPAAWLATKPWTVHDEDGLIALRVSLGPTDVRGLRARFVPNWNDYYDVLLAFPSRTADQAVDRALAGAIAISAAAPGTPFEFEWRVLQDGAVAAQGGGSPAGAVLGEGGRRKLLFGEFRARAGHTYELHASFGAGMTKFLSASPALEVRMANTPRVNRLRYFRRLDGGSSLALGLVGLGFLVAGLRLERKIPERKG